MKNIFVSVIITISAVLLFSLTECSNPDSESNMKEQNELLQQGRDPVAGHRRKDRNRSKMRIDKHDNKPIESIDNKVDFWKSSITLSQEEEQTVKPVLDSVQSRQISNELSAMGKILANQYRKAIVSYPFAARVAEVKVKIGQNVDKGDKLVLLQSETVGVAISEYYKASADFELAIVTYDREKQLFEKGVGAKKNLLTSEAEMKVSEVNKEASEKKLHILGFTEDDIDLINKTHQINPHITLYSPISGKVIASDLVLGEMIDESTELFTIMDPSQLWVDAAIYERDISRIKIGQKVTAEVPAYPGVDFKGSVTYIGDILNEDTRTITVRAELNNSLSRLKPGMFADLRIVVSTDNNALTVPATSVLDDKGKKLVFVRFGDEYFPREVEVGPLDGEYISILKGLKEGELVVSKGNFELKSKLYEQVLRNTGAH